MVMLQLQSSVTINNTRGTFMQQGAWCGGMQQRHHVCIFAALQEVAVLTQVVHN